MVMDPYSSSRLATSSSGPTACCTTDGVQLGKKKSSPRTYRSHSKPYLMCSTQGILSLPKEFDELRCYVFRMDHAGLRSPLRPLWPLIMISQSSNTSVLRRCCICSFSITILLYNDRFLGSILTNKNINMVQIY